MSASCHKHNVGINRLLLTLAFEDYPIAGDGFHCCLQIEGDTTVFHLLAQSFGNVGIECGQAFFEKLHHSDLTAEAGKDAGKLHTDNSGSDDAQPLRNMVDVEQFG